MRGRGAAADLFSPGVRPRQWFSGAPLVSLVLVGCLFTVNPARAGETAPICHLEKYIDEPSLIALVEAKDADSLRHIWLSLWYHDLVQRVAYYTRLVGLDVVKRNELELLETLPGSPLDFYYIYAISDTGAARTRPAIQGFCGTYFKTVARLAAKHPEYIPRLLPMSRLADGEAKNYTDEANDILRALNPSGYLAALKGLDSVTQTFVCGDCPELREEQVRPKKDK